MEIKNDNLGDVKDYLLNEKDYSNSESSKEELVNKATLNIDKLIARVCGVSKKNEEVDRIIETVKK